MHRILNNLEISRHAIATSFNAMAFLTMEGEIGYVNKTFHNMWEIDQCDSVINTPIQEYLADSSDVKSVLGVVAEEGHWIGEISAIRRNGDTFCVQLTANTIRDEKNSLLCVMFSFVDISETKKLQAALSRSEETYAKAEEIAHIGSWDWDILTGDLHWTDEIYRIFGQEPKSFGATYEAFLETIHEDDRQLVIDAVNAAVADENVEYNIEHRIVRIRTGEERIVQERGKVYRNEAGDPVRMIGTVYDITEQRKKDEELRRYRDQLEELVEERTRELHKAQEDLVRSERLATLGQLTATVSHELRNPLGAMRPSLYLIKKKIGDQGSLRPAYERLERNIARCDHIIDELLDFTRITQLETRATTLNVWLDEVINEVPIPEDIVIEKDYRVDVVANFDPDRLRRAVINVLDNAWQAIQESKQESTDKRRLVIRTGIKQGQLFIEIQDSGGGMSDDVAKRIFEPLYSTKGFGVGLGMPTVKQIMEQHRGGVEVVSELGKGTEVRLCLPIGSVYENGDGYNEACVGR